MGDWGLNWSSCTELHLKKKENYWKHWCRVQSHDSPSSHQTKVKVLIKLEEKEKSLSQLISVNLMTLSAFRSDKRLHLWWRSAHQSLQRFSRFWTCTWTGVQSRCLNGTRVGSHPCSKVHLVSVLHHPSTWAALIITSIENKHDGNVSENNKVIHWHIFTYTSRIIALVNWNRGGRGGRGGGGLTAGLQRGTRLFRGTVKEGGLKEDPSTWSAFKLGMFQIPFLSAGPTTRIKRACRGSVCACAINSSTNLTSRNVLEMKPLTRPHTQKYITTLVRMEQNETPAQPWDTHTHTHTHSWP